jgi:hypothetical protein
MEALVEGAERKATFAAFTTALPTLTVLSGAGELLS